MAKAQGRGIAKIQKLTSRDIRYRGPLNYQHFQILGWLCIVMSQAHFIITIGGKLDPSVPEQFSGLDSFLELAAGLSLPFLLIANFAQILDDSDGYKKQLIKNTAATLGVTALYLLLYNRYLVGSLAGLFVNPSDAAVLVRSLFQMLNPLGFMSFNLFVDLLLCTLVMFFLNYMPKKLFQGKLRIVFRLFTLLPIAYEVYCMILKVQASHGYIELPAWFFPLLPVKPPMTFVLFLILAVYIKTRELRFRRHGKTHEEYKAFLKTNRNSWNFSVFLAIMLVVVSVMDFLVLTVASVIGGSVSYTKKVELEAVLASTAADSASDAIEEDSVITVAPAEAAAVTAMPAATASAAEAVTETASPETNPAAASAVPEAEAAAAAALSEAKAGETASPDPVKEELMELSTWEAYTMYNLGFGGSFNLMLLAPLVLLFSYTRTPRAPKAGMLIPFGGIILILFVYLEAFRLLMWNLPARKLDLSEMSTMMMQFVDMIR